jgi:hypothetical protein
MLASQKATTPTMVDIGNVKPSPSLELTVSTSSDCTDNAEVKTGVVQESNPSMELACQLVHKLLDQVAWNDAPPSNEEFSRKVASKVTPASKSPVAAISRQRHVRPPMPASDNKSLATTNTTTSQDPSDLWNAQYQVRCNPAEQKLGNVALATLCARTLETVGKSSVPTREASERKIPSPAAMNKVLSPRHSSSPKTSNWLRRRGRKNSPLAAKLGLTSPSSQVGGGEDRDHINTSPSSLADNEECEPTTSRLQMFGSEYARYLSTTALAPKETITNVRPSTSSLPRGIHLRRREVRTSKNLEDTDVPILTGAITDLIITHGEELPPKGYYRISQSGNGEAFAFALKDRKTPVYINVKKEANWDRAAQRPCLTALAIIFPERKEFVPPGFSVVRRHQCVPTENNSSPADLNFGGEPVYLCFRRSREGNPITGIIPLQPSKREPIPEGYTVLERTPRNFVATINTAGAPVFLAFRQRLANLEPLRPLPLVLSVHKNVSSTRKLNAYYCTGGTIVESKVGRFHIMDRSTHSLLSPSSVRNRLSLIEISRRKALNSITDLPSGLENTYSSSTNVNGSRPPRSSSELLTSSLLLAHGLGTHGSKSVVSDLERMSSAGDFESASSSFASSFDGHQSVIAHGEKFNVSFSATSIASDDDSNGTSLVPLAVASISSNNDGELERCLDALSFIPVVSTGVNGKDPRGMLHFQSKVAILTPVLTACYTRHGGSALIAVEGLTSLLRGDFFVTDVNLEQDSSSRLTLLDISVQVVCDVATMGAQETHLQTCVEFVDAAVRCGCGHLNTRTVGYVLRFYLFVFYFGASTPTQGSYPVWGTKQGIDEYMLADPRTSKSLYLPGGAPQMAALSLKDLISFSIDRLRSLAIPHGSVSRLSTVVESPPNNFLDNLLSELVDNSVNRVDIANYTQLAVHQIHRSGGSELFWYDMMNSCGMGLFGSDKTLKEDCRNMYTLCFAILANLVKVASSKVRKGKQSQDIPRDVASKLLSLELLHFFLEKWGYQQDSSQVRGSSSGSRSVSTFAFCVRRLVVPCLIFNTKEALEDSRIYRRVLRIFGVLWCLPVYRNNMKLEIGILFEHFVLKILQLGPQFASKANKSKGFSPSLLEQQIDLMKELKTWFSGDSRDLLELYINFDTDTSSQVVSGPIELLSGIQWNLFQRLNASLCSIVEQCGEFIGNQIEHSQSMSSTKGEAERAEPEEGESDVILQAAAQRLRKSALEAIAQLVKSLAQSAAKSAGPKFSTLLETWTIRNEPSHLDMEDGASVTSGTSAESQKDHDSEGEENEVPGLESPRPLIDRHSIVGYWQRAIVTERQRPPPEPVLKVEIANNNAASRQGSSPVYSRIARVPDGEVASGKIDHLGIAFDIAEKKGLKKAIDYLIACNVLTPSPRDIASFLRIHKADLSKTALGRYLGEGGLNRSETEYWNFLRFNYIRAISFAGLNVEQG